MLKELGRPEKATRLLSRYISVNAETRDAFGLDRHSAFADEVRDDELIQAFREKYASFVEQRNPIDVIVSNAKNGGCDEDYAFGATVAVEDIVKELRSRKNDDLRTFIDACIGSDRIINARESEREISRKAKEALGKLAENSRINALRVRRYGIRTEQPDDSKRHEQK